MCNGCTWNISEFHDSLESHAQHMSLWMCKYSKIQINPKSKTHLIPSISDEGYSACSMIDHEQSSRCLYQESGNHVLRVKISPRSVLYSLWTKDYYIFRKNTYDRHCMWITKFRIFTVWPFMESVCQPLICINGRTKAFKSPKLHLVILRVNTVVTILSWMPIYYTIPTSSCWQQNKKGNKTLVFCLVFSWWITATELLVFS